ncbi:MAG: YceI family protein [Mucilaginibacter sp.]|uniref:YceI family protein n=1 Tax=Mucilaginibacter sp. TaxID=1882438 RepID=UPI0034E5D151
MKKIAVILFLAPFFVCTAFSQTSQKVTSSAVTFKIKNLGINTEGSFGGFKATIIFDKEPLESSSIEASVDTRTINSDNEMRDDHLKKEAYFDVAHYPEIKMKSVALKHQKGENYTGDFDVTIKAKTKRIKLPFTYTENDSGNSFKGSFPIKRSDFDIGGKSMVLSDDALVTIAVETTK